MDPLLTSPTGCLISLTEDSTTLSWIVMALLLGNGGIWGTAMIDFITFASSTFEFISIKIWGLTHQYNDNPFFLFLYVCLFLRSNQNCGQIDLLLPNAPIYDLKNVIHPIVFLDPSLLEFNNVHLIFIYLSILKCFFLRELFTRCEWLNIWRSLRSIGATVFPWDFARQYISVSPRNLTLLVMARRRRSSNVVQLSLQVRRSVQKLSVIKTPLFQSILQFLTLFKRGEGGGGVKPMFKKNCRFRNSLTNAQCPRKGLESFNKCSKGREGGSKAF